MATLPPKQNIILFLTDRYTVLMATCATTRSMVSDDLLKCIDLLVEKGANINDFDR